MAPRGEKTKSEKQKKRKTKRNDRCIYMLTAVASICMPTDLGIVWRVDLVSICPIDFMCSTPLVSSCSFREVIALLSPQVTSLLKKRCPPCLSAPPAIQPIGIKLLGEKIDLQQQAGLGHFAEINWPSRRKNFKRDSDLFGEKKMPVSPPPPHARLKDGVVFSRHGRGKSD